MRDHEIAQLVNALRDTAIQYRDTEQLRERIAGLVRPLATPSPAEAKRIVDLVAVERMAARAQALEDAAAAITQHDRKGREWIPGSLWDTLSNEAAARIRALMEIRHA